MRYISPTGLGRPSHTGSEALAKTRKARLYLRHDGATYSFLSAQLNPGSDGSLLLTMVREGLTGTSVRMSAKFDGGDVRVSEPIETSKGFRMTYHPTGQINFHHLYAAPIFMEPLSRITRVEPLIDISVPDVKSLDQATIIKKDAAVLDVSSGRQSFTVQIAPWDAPGTEIPVLWAWTWRPLFSLRVLAASYLPPHMLDALPKHFHYVARRLGIFPELPIREEDAKVAFHKVLNEAKGDVLYPPDGEGKCRLVFVATMRKVPVVEIGLRDATLTVEITDVTTTEIRYQVRDANYQLVRDMRAVDLLHHTRDAEL